MEYPNPNVSKAIVALEANLSEVARVFEWARLMGYEDPKRFSERFLRHYGVRPQKVLELIRLESIIRDLRGAESHSSLRIARLHSMPDEKTLNNFTNYHTGYSPTRLRNISKEEVGMLLENLWSKIREEYAVEKVWSAPLRRRW